MAALSENGGASGDEKQTIKAMWPNDYECYTHSFEKKTLPNM